jgi:DNA mismatch repair protein MutL
MIIRKLPTEIINQISAGELIENPASIIRELVENSIDAGATSIQVFIKNGGKTYISITDNGSGIRREDLAICLDQHTTSKLRSENLHEIDSLGFRGEALFSIATVACITIHSKIENGNGYSISSNFGDKSQIKESPVNNGTQIEITRLFLRTPGRLKFLKSDSTEKKIIEDLIRKFSLIYNNISFRLINDGEVILSYAKTNSIEERIYEIMDSDFAKNSTSLEYLGESPYGKYKIRGIISIPTFNKSSKTHQYIFINGRFIKESLASKIINREYNDLTPKNRHPVLVIFLEIPPVEIDVNVHPTKAEVKFRNIDYLIKFLSTGIREAILSTKHKARSFDSHSSIGTSIGTAIEIEKIVNHLKIDNVNDLKESISNSLSSDLSKLSSFTMIKHDDAFNSEEDLLKAKPSYQPFLMESMESLKHAYNLGVAVCQISNSYIISEVVNQGIVIIDQHAAHERINYERLKLELLEINLFPCENLLIPLKVEIKKNIHESLINILNKFGFNAKYENKTIEINSIPLLLKGKNIKEIISEIIDEVNEYNDLISDQNVGHYIDKVCGTIACHSSITANHKLSIQEMNELIKQMEITPNIAQCNHGRPTHVFISNADLEKMFERR